MVGLTFKECDCAVDSGLTRTTRYNVSTNLNEMLDIPSKEAHIKQRMGRVARTTDSRTYYLLQPSSFRDGSNKFGLVKPRYGIT